MATDNTHDIRVLNGLIAATQASADDCRGAIDESANEGHVGLFDARCDVHEKALDQLRQAVTGMGGTPEHGGSILDKAQRAIKDIKHALIRDEHALVSRVETGEADLQHRYDRALQDAGISATTRETIRRASAAIREGHTDLTALRESLRSRKDADSDLFPQ